MKKLFFLITLFCLSAGYSYAQEICNDNMDNDGNGLVDCLDPTECPTKTCEICDNGIDDDGDRFIDCYDKECVLSKVCKDFFIGKTDSCNVKPEVFPPFEMKLKFKSQPGTANHVNRLLVGDVDSDGVPELVTTYRSGSSNPTSGVVNVLQAPTTGIALTIDKQINLLSDGYRPTFEDIAMADINKDGCVEYFVLHTDSDNSGYKIIAYDCTGKKVWNNPISFPDNPGTMGLTDFDGDGAVELYVRAQIYDAHTGTKMAENLFNGAFMENSNGPIAANILTASPNQELISGCRIYSVNINRPAAPGAVLPTAVTPPVNGSTLTLTKSLNNYFTRRDRTKGSATSIADFNLDGFLDVVAVGSLIDDANNNKQTTTIFFWDVEHNTSKTFTDYFATSAEPASEQDSRYDNGWTNGAGRVNIADIDGDGKMNAVYVSGRYLYALKEGGANLEILWKEKVVEQTSGFTGCTMFDFNADGKSEIVYRDEDYLYIFTTAVTAGVANVTRSTPIRCASRTSNEYPIVADMNGDGSTEICVVCSTDESKFGKDLSLYNDAEVRVYESANVPWVPARKVWNQHGYFVVNVNDNLTIPRQIQQHHLVYSNNAECFVDKLSRPLNNFLNQAPYLNSFGCPSYAAPNLSVVPFNPNDPTAPQLKIDAPTCPDKNIGVTFKFRNKGDVLVSGGLNITFYNGDPRTNSAVKISTTKITLTEMAPGDTITQKVTIAGNGSPFTLYVALNDDGTTIPLDIEKQPGRIRECDYGDNVLFAPVNPGLASLSTISIPDSKCTSAPGGGAIPNKGIAKAYGPGKDSVNYTFYWFNGHIAGAPGTAVYKGYAYSKLPAGEYTVYAVHNTAKCGSDTAHVIILDKPSDPPKAAVIEVDNTNCKNSNGSLHVDLAPAVVGGPNIPVNLALYTIEWTSTLTGDILGVAPDLLGLGEGSYRVVLTDKKTGCQGQSPGQIDKVVANPDIAITIQNILCLNTNSGRLDATADGQTSGYTFNWYKGNAVKTTPDKANSPFYDNLKAQKYTLNVINNTSLCESKKTVTLTQTTPPTITSLVKDDQLSCDNAHPTGEATVTATAATTPITYQWYFGNSTVDKVPSGTGATVTALKAGLYTVVVTETTTGCLVSDTVRVDDKRIKVEVTPTATAKSSCAPVNGKIEITSVKSGSVSDYTFIWTNISDDPATTLPDTDGTVEGLEPGSYQVVAVHTQYTCRSLPVTVKVENNTPKIVLTNPNLKAASDCQNAKDGIFTVEVTAPITPSKFNFAWFDNDGNSLHEQLGVTRDSIINGQGLYSVKITNPENGCDTIAYATIPFENGHTIDVTTEDVAKCAPFEGGAIHVTLNHSIGYNDVDYDILLYRTNKDPDAKNSYLTHSPPFVGLIPGAVPPAAGKFDTDFDLAATKVGTSYTVVAVNKTLPLQGCRYAKVVTIRRTGAVPEIIPTLTGITANMNCDASIPTGTGGITVAMKDNAPANYSFAWTNLDDNTAVPSTNRFGVNDKDLRFMLANELGYEVVFTTTTDLNEGCSNRATFLIPAIEQDLRLVDGGFKAKAITQCIPGSPTSAIMTNGSAEFVALQKDGVPVAAPFAGFTFSWLDRNTNTTLPPVTNPIANLDSGKYTAIAKYGATGCDVKFDFIIQDSTLGSVGMDLIAFGKEIMCVDPIPGFLEVQATSETETGQNYEFTWFGYDNLGTRTLVRGPILAASDKLADQTSITDFTVRVLNPRNNCWVEDTHTIFLEAIEFSVRPSATPITQCPNPLLGIIENGATFASVTRADGLPVSQDNFEFHWYDENDNPIGVAQDLKDLSSVYLGRDIKVIAVDKIDSRAACKSAPAIVRLTRMVEPVPISLAILNPVTNCDEDIPNGMAAANVNGDIVNYQFNWFDEDGAAILPLDPANAFRTDFLADSLKRADYIYTILATDLISGCVSDTTLTIPYQPLPVPIPTIEIISQITSCIENNGALSVSVGGNTQDYIFRWYDNTVTKPNTETVSPDAYTFIRDTLAAQIPYGVIAVDRATKCESDLVYEILQFTPTYPQFDLEVTPASCGHPDGTVSLLVTNSVDIDEIIWDVNPGTISGDPKLGGLVSSKPGEIYTVRVVTLLGCAADTTFVIGSEIHPFNGISRNGDDRNSYFHIDCIEEFQSNVVRIFNRAGTLVYQAEGYNNNSILFDGLSNRGISPMGNNLPDGTYFYVIDKRNGSKPLAGYLEIVN
jgi:hypothetical protein